MTGAAVDAQPTVGDAMDAPSRRLAASTATRPQLTAEEAESNTMLEHFAFVGDLAAGLVYDPWDPRAGLGDVSAFVADFVVAETGGTHTTVAAAIAEATLLGGTERVHIRVAQGTYREVVCVPVEAPPITLYSTDPDASLTTIVFNNNQAKPKLMGEPANPCNPNLSGETLARAAAPPLRSTPTTFRRRTSPSPTTSRRMA